MSGGPTIALGIRIYGVDGGAAAVVKRSTRLLVGKGGKVHFST